jgi:haloacetate dehalogenase
MGQLQIKLMRRLGFEHFAVVGHDRGARVAYRMALDHRHIIDRLAVLDIVATSDMWRRADREFGLAYWHWYFLAQPYDLPERIIATDPEAFYGRRWLPSFHPDAVADYRQALATPGTIHAICEDYRAAAGIDREHDEMDRRRQRRIQCPVLVLWGRHDGRSLEHWFDVVGLWRQWADDVQGRALDCGHHLPEELPGETAAELLSFLQPPAT